MVQDGSAVSVEYTLTLDNGDTIDSNVGGEPLAFQQGGGKMLPAFEAQLAGLKADETKQFNLAPEDGYGIVHTELRAEIEASLIPEGARVPGTQLMSSDPEGKQRPVTVYAVNGEKIVIDYNHPLAGQTLHFDVKIISVE